MISEKNDFRLPVPIPEPLRIINTKPIVPDLSFTSDLSVCSSNQLKKSNRDTDLKLNCFYDFLNSQSSPEIFLDKNNIQRTESLAKKFSQFIETYPHSKSSSKSSFNCKLKNPLFKTTSNQDENLKKNCVHSLNKNLEKILKSQEEQFEKISKQIEKVLELNKLEYEKKKISKRSVETITSFVFEKSPKKLKNQTNHNHCSQTNSILECLRDTSLLAEEIRASSDQEDDFYYQILEQVSERLTNSLSDLDKSNSSLNFYSPVKVVNHRNKLKDSKKKRFSSKKSEESILIDKLAEKYLSKKKFKNFNLNHNRINNFIKTDLKDDYICKNFDLIENASIATKNYLKKYGLLNDLEIKIKKI